MLTNDVVSFEQPGPVLYNVTLIALTVQGGTYSVGKIDFLYALSPSFLSSKKRAENLPTLLKSNTYTIAMPYSTFRLSVAGRQCFT